MSKNAPCRRCADNANVKNRRLVMLAFGIAGLCLVMQQDQVFAINWDGGAGGTGTEWTTAANWVGDVEPGAGDTAVFTNASGATATNISLSSDRTAGKLIFTNTLTFTLNNSGGGDLTLNGVGGEIIDNDRGNTNVSVDIILGADGQKIQNQSGRPFTLNSAISDGANSYGLIIENLAAGNNDRIFIGGSANTYDGETTLRGHVEVQKNSAFATGKVNWEDGVNDTIKFSGDRTLANDFELASGFSPTLQRQSGTTITLSGDITGGDALQTLTIDAGSGSTFVLDGSNSFANSIFITQGTLQISGSLSHVNMTDDASASALTGTGTITWNVAGATTDLMNLDQSTVNITQLDLVLEGSPTMFGTPYTIANYLSLTGSMFESITNNTGQLYTIDYGTGASSSITLTFVSVPEPSGLLLGGIAVGALAIAGGRRWRRSR